MMYFPFAEELPTRSAQRLESCLVLTHVWPEILLGILCVS